MSVTTIILITVVTVSFFTPVFSYLGLGILNLLPIPEVTHSEYSAFNSFHSASPSSNSQHTNRIQKTEEPADADNDYSSFYPLELTIHHKPSAYVVLGGGLTEASDFDDILSQDKYIEDAGNTEELSNSVDAQASSLNSNQSLTYYPLAANTIVLNQYSLTRMITVLKHYKFKPLPIVLTGVESPWMQEWLNHHGIKDIVSENASMNTCENARFTAKRLHLVDVYLITDAYHMTRTRRQFALNNIHTIPIVAPLPMQKGWLKPRNNAQHSRRTLYELAAYTRDVFLPQGNCREAEEVSFDTLLKSRRDN